MRSRGAAHRRKQRTTHPRRDEPHGRAGSLGRRETQESTTVRCELPAEQGCPWGRDGGATVAPVSQRGEEAEDERHGSYSRSGVLIQGQDVPNNSHKQQTAPQP